MNSNPASMSAPELSPSKIHTGSLLSSLGEAMQAEVLEKPYTKLPLTKNLTYIQQLSDPRWKAKRLSILKRDNFACVVCSKTKQLQVHHTKYTGYAWEAPDTDLLTLCLDCHESMHNKQAPSTQRHLGVFSLMFSTALLKASKIAYEAMPTLGVLISKVEYENVVRVRTVTIARELGVSVATVDRHMKKLRELNIIEPDAIEEDKQRGITSWRICPFLGWKGSSDKIPHYLKTLPPTHSWHSFNDEVAVEIFKDQTN